MTLYVAAKAIKGFRIWQARFNQTWCCSCLHPLRRHLEDQHARSRNANVGALANSIIHIPVWQHSSPIQHIDVLGVTNHFSIIVTDRIRSYLIFHDIFRVQLNIISPPPILGLFGIPLWYTDYPDVCTNAELFLCLIKQHDTKIVKIQREWRNSSMYFKPFC